MGQSLPKHPNKPIDRSDNDRKNEEIIFPDEENVILDHNDKLEQYYVAYSTITFQIKDLTKYEIDEQVFQQCEMQRGIRHYFKMQNILENFDGDEIFIKVINFSQEILSKDDINEEKMRIMKVNKRLVKEAIILESCKARFITQPLGYFNNRAHQSIYLIFEFVNRRLHDLFTDVSLGPFLNKMRLFKNLIDIVLYLHLSGIVSYDISPYSIGVIGKQNAAKLLTFGNSIKFTGEAIDVLRESWFDREKFDFFTSPELYLNKTILLRYCWSADIWSLGVLAYIMFRKDYASFYYKLDNEFIDKETSLYTDEGGFVASEFYQVFDMSKIENPFIKSLIISMLRLEFTERPTILK